MKIVSVNSSPIVFATPLTFRGKSSLDKTPGEDSFCPENKKFNESMRYARNKILENLQGENQTEYGVAISKDGTILDEALGTRYQCSLDPLKMLPGAIVIHGHPDKALLSPGDALTLLANPNVEEITALTKDGTYSKLSKDTSGFKYSSKSPDLNEIYGELFEPALKYLGVSTNDTPEEVEKIFQRYAQKTATPLETARQMSLEKAKEYLRVFDGSFLMSPAKRYLEYAKEVDNLFNTQPDVRLKIENEFLTNVAKKFGLEYTTNYDASL